MHTTSNPALILIAGGPGAGKTALGRALGRRIASAVLLDKDVLCAGWVDAILNRFNDGQVDRDSKLYWDLVRPLEYSALLEAVLDNLALGKTVIVVAPFGPELRNPEWVSHHDTTLQDQLFRNAARGAGPADPDGARRDPGGAHGRGARRRRTDDDEITLRTDVAVSAIRAIRDQVPSVIGAGTLLNG